MDPALEVPISKNIMSVDSRLCPDVIRLHLGQSTGVQRYITHVTLFCRHGENNYIIMVHRSEAIHINNWNVEAAQDMAGLYVETGLKLLY